MALSTKMMKKPAGAMKAKKVSIIARGKRAKSAVFSGRKQKTTSGLKMQDLIRTKTGKIVSKKASEVRKKLNKGSRFEKWVKSVKEARKELGITGFMIIGGSNPAGKALYAKAKELFGKA